MALTNPLKIAIDRQAQAIASVAGFASSFGSLYQGNVRDVVIQALDPNVSGSLSGPAYLPAALLGYQMILTISTTPNGNNTQTILAQNSTMTWDAINNWFFGSLDLTQSPLAEAIGSASSITATVEIEVVLNGVHQTIYQNTLTIFAPADGGALVNPANPQLYITLAQAIAMFAQLGPVVGQKMLLVSPDGTQCRLFGCGNDGSLQWEPVVPVPGQ